MTKASELLQKLGESESDTEHWKTSPGGGDKDHRKAMDHLHKHGRVLSKHKKDSSSVSHAEEHTEYDLNGHHFKVHKAADLHMISGSKKSMEHLKHASK